MPKISILEAKQLNIPQMSIQAVLISNKLLLNDAKLWLKDHLFKHKFYEKSKNYNIFRQLPDIENAKFYEKKLSNEIILRYQVY